MENFYNRGRWSLIHPEMAIEEINTNARCTIAFSQAFG